MLRKIDDALHQKSALQQGQIKMKCFNILKVGNKRLLCPWGQLFNSKYSTLIDTFFGLRKIATCRF